MILVESGKRDAKSFDAKILFAMQLAQRGHHVGIDEASMPDDIERHQKYEVAPYLTKIQDADVTGVVMISAEEIEDETLLLLRSLNLPSDALVAATGRFKTHQAYVGAASKLAYALGQEPNLVDLNDLQQKQILETSITPLAANRVKTGYVPPKTPELFVFVPAESLEDPLFLPAIASLDHFRLFNLNVVTTGAGQEQIRKSGHSDLNVFGITELSPSTFAKIANIAAFFGDRVPGERMASFALDLMRLGGAVVDCTTNAAFATSGAPALRGPQDPGALGLYVENTVHPNLAEIARQAQTNEWLESNSFSNLLSSMGLQAHDPEVGQNGPGRQTLFVPTNGNGLGHAQRCSLIATELDDQSHTRFAAFPSCVGLIQSKGFPCGPLVQKSEFHQDGYANDIVNYLRLRRSLRAHDKLVFDGGYVFDSIYRTIVENGLHGIWIRRGLWQAGQIKKSAFAREKAFKQVIVPQEAFEELNASYTFGDNIHPVGPILQKAQATPDDIAATRLKLGAEFECDFDELIVTMLGGGVAADRSAQIQSMCALAENRPDCLHLVVVWPGSKVSPGLTNWKNTRVVKTRNALGLCQTADLVVSAVGYNSFHELMYHAIPSILVPQMAPFMDDQERRARAASDRGLAATVLGHELLLLEREVNAFLDHGKADEVRTALGVTSFPERGNQAAARLIENGGDHV
ncbi:MAG: hypothetical protein ACSHXD_09885 [Marinosulfonomonas sp.]